MVLPTRPVGVGLAFTGALVVGSLPSLELAGAGSLLVVVVAYAMASRAIWRRWSSTPRSLTATHISIGVIVASTVIRAAETALATGQLSVPSWADVVAVPGFLAVTASLFAAARTRAATSRVNDLVDALATALVPLTAVAIVAWPYLVGETGASLGARTVNGAVFAVDAVFLTLMLLLVYGPGSRSGAAVWLGLAGTLTVVFDLSLLYGTATDATWSGQPVRIAGLGIVAYAVAVTQPDYREFAEPGTRPQQYRWQLYRVVLCSIAVLGYLTEHPLAVIAFVGATALTTTRVALAGRTAVRLTQVAEVQSHLAEDLSRAASLSAAVRAAEGACRSLLGDRKLTIVTRSGRAGDSGAGADVGKEPVDGAAVKRGGRSAAMSTYTTATAAPLSESRGGRAGGTAASIRRTPVSSTLANVCILVDGDVPPYLYVALTQVANVLDPALTSIEERIRRLELEAEAKAEEAWQALAAASREIALRAHDGRIIKATPNAVRDLGFNPVGRLVGQIASLVHPLANTDNTYEDPYCDDRWIKSNSTTQADGSTIFIIRDVTAEHRAARTDPVTGLPNLVDFNRAADVTRSVVSVLYFHDLDRASESRAEADELFGRLAARTVERFRAGDDRLWRGEGPSLIVVSPAGTSPDWIEGRREELAAHVEALLPITPSVTAGVVVVDEPMTAEGALLRADMAVKHGQVHAPGSTTFFSGELQDRIKRTWQIEARLSTALSDSDPGEHGFRVEYQPIVDADTRVATTLEALVRWTHPDLGPIYPDEFIPLAEKHGLVDRIDRHVLRVALRDLVAFRRYHPDMKVHVNLSPTGLDVQKLDLLCEQLRTNPLSRHIVVEITETSLGRQDLPMLVAACHRIAELGVALSIDDFGTGESNFARISELPVGEVKLARHFAESGDPLMVESVVQTLHTLNKSVVAENVETDEQADLLTAAGVDHLQGYLFSRPQPYGPLMEWLVEQTDRPPITDGSTVGEPCQDGTDGHERCLGWWKPSNGEPITCACGCHARAGEWKGWNGYTLDLSSTAP